MRITAQCACRDCAQSGFGGPAENRFTAYDAAAAGVWVNLSNLTLYVRETDLAFGGFGLERSYNQDDTAAGPFGIGWTFNLGDSLTVDTDGTLVVRRGAGRIDRFGASSSGSYFALTGTTDRLVKNDDGTYTLRATGATAGRVFTSDGRLLSTPAATLDYDAAGRLTAARYRGSRITFTYDGDGHIASAADSAGRTVNYTYTGGRLESNGSSTYEYDDAGNLTSVNGTSIGYAGDADYTAVASVGARSYDAPLAPSQIRVTDGNGDATWYVSNAGGLVLSVTDANGSAVSYAYDAAGRRTAVTNGTGRTARFTYDSGGNLTGVVDAASNRWSAEYSASRLSRVTDPNGNAWSFQYDAAGNLTGVTDPAGGAAAAARNDGGQVTKLTNAMGNGTAYTYNSDGLVGAFTDAVGGQWTYEYDGASRVASRTDPGGTVIQAGDVPAAVAPCHPNPDCGDGFGNHITADANGRIVALTMPGDKTVSYQYDHAGRLAMVSDWLGNFAVYRYDAAGWPVSVSVSGGPVTIYQYDAAHRLRAIVSTGPDGSPVAGYRYTLDANGNRTAVSALEPSTAAGTAASYTYGLDAAGHPVSRSDGESYQYDARGNLTAIAGGRNITFGYDGLGRLTGSSGDIATSYTYDGALRVARTVDGVERHFDVFQDRVVMESDGDGAPVAWYIYGRGLLWKVTADEIPYFYHFDGDGNVVAVSNPAAGIVNRYRYDPEGRLVASEEGVENPFRARGEAGWMDDGNGLLFTGRAFRFAELRLTLPAGVDLSPPPARLLPALRGAGACFLEGVASCAFASGGREQ